MLLQLQYVDPDVLVTLSPADAAGDRFSNRNGKSRGWVKNVAGTAKRVIVTRQRPNSDGDLVDWTLTVQPSETVPIEDINAFNFNEVGTGEVHLSYPDGATGLLVGAEGRT